jgi:glycerophosphoryl diester phosphodiesterase
MKPYMFFLILVISLFSCKKSKEQNVVKSISSATIQEKIANLKDSKNKEIIVVAHRGDWRNAPENSLQAIQNCIDMGVDMVEIDIGETKDGHLVLMHDDTIGRTTNGRGYLKEWTLDSLKTLRLVDGLRVATNHKIPTLKEALELAKGKILINLDKSYKIFDKCFKVIKETETIDQVVIKGNKTKDEVETEFGEYLDKVLFMPIIRLPNKNAKKIIADYMVSNNPVAFEFTVKYDTISLIEDFDDIRAAGTSVWVNSLWPRHNGGHDDEKAALDPTIYQWYIDNNIDIIQTDRPEILLDFLRSVKRHK